MCGIIGYSGQRNATEVLIDGLKRLEYRGYDSAGIAVNNDEIVIYKDKGEISELGGSVPEVSTNVGIGHTRWATCGKPSQENAHPFLDCSQKFALVHNGIIENSSRLRRELKEQGHRFTSETDTEVVVHLLEKHYDGDLHEALRKAIGEVEGTYAIAVIMKGSEEIVVARKNSPLVIGLGVGENLVASDVTPLLNYTSRVIYLQEGDSAIISADEIRMFNSEGKEIRRGVSEVDWTVEDAQKGGFEHFMLKEIHEQPSAIHNTLINSIQALREKQILDNMNIDSAKIIACGTSYHAGMIGRYLIEELADIPVIVELASEYRYSPSSKSFPLTIFISQSGETADTLAALAKAKQRGYDTLAITNVVGSTLTREAHNVLYTHAGPEIGVAATKTFITQLVSLCLLSIELGLANGSLKQDAYDSIISELRLLPLQVKKILDKQEEIERATEIIDDARDVFFIGRNINYPTVLEGALKLKEISYVHAEGCAAGELKHGPLALIDPSTPVIAVCIQDRTYDKMISNISEVMAREGPVLAVGTEGDEELERIADLTISIPEVNPLLSPILVSVVLQLLAYHTARKRGCAIDKPRNLAKSVTVE